jgi:hypothetical protein
MPRRVLIPAGLFLCLLAASLKVPAQSNVSRNTSLTPPSAPAPLLSPEGYTDENGWAWPGTEWKQVSPESEGFSAERLEALRSFLKTHHGRNNPFLVTQLCQRFCNRPIAVAVEQGKESLVFTLRNYEPLHLYPVPPAYSASFQRIKH